jgi:hypothetical protein
MTRRIVKQPPVKLSVMHVAQGHDARAIRLSTPTKRHNHYHKDMHITTAAHPLSEKKNAASKQLSFFYSCRPRGVIGHVASRAAPRKPCYPGFSLSDSGP